MGRTKNAPMFNYYMVRYEGTVHSKNGDSKSFYTDIVKAKTIDNAIQNAKRRSNERMLDWYSEKPVAIMYTCNSMGQRLSFGGETLIK